MILTESRLVSRVLTCDRVFSRIFTEVPRGSHVFSRLLTDSFIVSRCLALFTYSHVFSYLLTSFRVILTASHVFSLLPGFFFLSSREFQHILPTPHVRLTGSCVIFTSSFVILTHFHALSPLPSCYRVLPYILTDPHYSSRLLTYCGLIFT